MGREEYRPRWAPHVLGEYERELDEDGKPEPTVVRMLCEACGDRHQHRCDSGAPITWILRFATNHLHRDVLDHEAFKRAIKDGG